MTYLIAGYDLNGFEGKNYDNFFDTPEYEKLSGSEEVGYIQYFEEGYLGYILGIVDGDSCVVDVNKAANHARKRVSRILSNLVDKKVFEKGIESPKYQIIMFEGV